MELSKLKINDILYHACKTDILSYKVIETHEYTNANKEIFKNYTLESIKSVLRINKLRVIVHETEKVDTFIFIGLADAETTLSDFGLNDFVIGEYHLNKQRAKMEYYTNIETDLYTEMCRDEKALKRSKNVYNKVKFIINEIRKLLKNNK